jgi:acylphosphatase
MNQRRRVYFAGHVQGVGFRYAAASLARRYQVTGYVQNLPDGRVVLVAEGEAAELDRCLDDLNREMKPYIRECQSEIGPPTGEFRGFEIRL